MLLSTPTRESRGGRGQEMVFNSAVALSDHVEGFGQAISRVCTINMCAHMGPRIVEWMQRTTIKVSSPLSEGNEEKEERMIERVHGIDRHKQFSTISVLNRQGEEVHFEGACREFGKYVEGLGATDSVVMEAST